MRTLLLFAMVSLLLATLDASADDLNIAALRDDANVATVQTGAEYGLVLGAGYARVTSFADRPLIIGADLTVGWAEVDIDDFRLRANALTPFVNGQRWKVLGGVAASLRGANNNLGRMINLGGDARILAGRYAPRGFIAAELGADWAFATHVEHGDTYRMIVYADAKDGWYGNTGSMLRAGLQGGVTLGRHDVILRAGRLVDTAGDPPLLPFYGTLTFNTRW
jgi:hypothetical protein